MIEKRKNYLSWDEAFMLLAHLIAQRSKDPNTQTGACIVDENKVIVGLGYNGWPRGIEEDDLPWGRQGDFLDKKYAYVVHAEENAIYNANKPTKNCIMYCTMFPCNKCVKAIIQNGIKEIVFYRDPYHDLDEWIAARRMLDLAGVKYRQYIPQYKIKLMKRNNPKLIIGITGTLGAGKGTVVEYLKQKGFKHFSVREYLKQEIKRRGMLFSVDSMYRVANELRTNNSPSFIVEQLYEQAKQSGGNCIIESIRTPGEAEVLKKLGNFYLIAVDADQRARYQRLIKRKGDEADSLSFERFVFEEKRQMSSTNPNEQNISRCIEMADFRIDNSGSFQDLHQQIDQILKKI